MALRIQKKLNFKKIKYYLIIKINKMEKIIVSDDILAEQMSGLIKHRISTIINCSKKIGNIFEKLFNYINIFGPDFNRENVQNIDYNYYKKTFNNDMCNNLKKIINTASKEKILIHSDKFDIRCVVFCIIAMIVQNINLVDSINILNNKLKEHNENDCNFNNIDKKYIDLLITIEKEKFNNNSYYHNDNNDKKINDKKINDDISIINDILKNNFYDETINNETIKEMLLVGMSINDIINSLFI